MDSNIDSYNNIQTIEYYSDFDKYGLFSFEKRIIDKYFVGKIVLDIGCGTGRTTFPLHNMGFNVIGIDYSEGMIKRAVEKYPQVRFEICNCEDMRFEDGSFENALFSFNGIMLERDYNMRAKMFSEIYRILVPGGVFFFTTPYMDNKVDRGYWKEKVQRNGLDLPVKEDRMQLGDEVTDEDGVQFFLHIPFCSEIEEMISITGFTCIGRGSRIEDFGEEKAEDELDDNYYWVVRK